MQRFLVFLLPFIVAGCMMAPKAPPRAVATAPDTPVVLDNFAFWNSQCDSTAFEIDVTQKPTNGSISTRSATTQIPDKPGIGSSGGCAGTEVASREVVYTPNPGFTGQDATALLIGNSKGSRALAYQISVR